MAEDGAGGGAGTWCRHMSSEAVIRELSKAFAGDGCVFCSSFDTLPNACDAVGSRSRSMHLASYIRRASYAQARLNHDYANRSQMSVL